ncbi:MAG: TetR/AcrR family transcriptional regulator [Planctomycetota bacterium]
MSMNWRQKQKEKLREHLFEISLELFKEQGYEQTTVQQITEKASVAKGTFFNHFPSKEHVVVEWYNRLTDESLAQVKKRGFSCAKEAVWEMAHAMAVHALKKPELLDVKARIVHASTMLTHAERKQDEEVGAFFQEHIRVGKQRGEIDAGVDEAFFADMIVALLTGTSHGWVLSRHGFDLNKTIQERIDFLFRAARPQSD